MVTDPTWIWRDCEHCGTPFGQPDDPGRKRRFCSGACRTGAYRARKRRQEQQDQQQREDDARRRAYAVLRKLRDQTPGTNGQPALSGLETRPAQPKE